MATYLQECCCYDVTFNSRLDEVVQGIKCQTNFDELGTSGSSVNIFSIDGIILGNIMCEKSALDFI